MSVLIEQVSKRLADLDCLLSADAQRLFHGRGQCYPGFEQVTVDLYAPVLLLIFFKGSDVTQEAVIIEQLQALAISQHGLSGLLVQRRYLQDSPMTCVWGRIPDESVAKRHGLSFHVRLGGRQNSGFFLDMEPGRHWLETQLQQRKTAGLGTKVLNLFAYTCAFSVIAQAAGSCSVVNVDMSKSALSQGRENHRLNGFDTRPIKFLGENILKSWSRIRKPGPYDVAIIDPPSYQPGSFVAEKDYRRILRRIPELMNNNADLLVCLNSPELGVEFIRETMAQECPSCQFVERLEPHPDFPDSNPDRQLKLFYFRYSAV